ncbi:E3 ubiquitin-protein ligase RGLG4 isoform X2 [Ziziphus jujuba]|uniref:E3 ubiquitin-protein ligase RGLG4 isoform X2 n=1 Tax=Ziziphus jujuba TaxID=326968 RepID=A0ABM4AAP0_ZIZJJ|nr:E3 ubiquitin-protein ligase RGLG4 isoform X2 [Ziziphus jujuba]
MGILTSIKKKKDVCISHDFRSLEEVTKTLIKQGLESSNLIIGIDFTKINERTGKDSFNNRSLHSINGSPNPYEQVICIIGKTLEHFNKDNLIPCFGFGDGRTSFAPVIEAAMDIVEKSGGQYHVLVIIASGEVTRSMDTSELSPQEEETIRSIVNASLYPLSIIVVGVGDGPWEGMNKFVKKIPAREFDNFQFVNFREIINKNVNLSNKEALFASAALMSIPNQYEKASRLGILGQVTGKAKKIAPRPPPTSYDHEASNLSRIMDSSAMIFKSSNLILGIDFTKSNEWTGKVSFNNQSLHTIGTSPNPYQQVISIIGSTWATFGEENVIPCFGFGDKITNDQEVFSFYDDESSCCGFDEVLGCYRRIVQYVELGGPTSFAPVIEAAIDIVERSGGQFHVLVIIADGQVTRSVNTSDKALSEQEEISIASILYASSYPLSIIVVGVGDGPWDDIKKFVGKIPAREFDLFQFINFTEIMNKTMTLSKKEALFANAFLKETTIHYKAAVEFGLLGRTTGKAKKIVPRPPPTFYAPHASTIGEASNLSMSMGDESHRMPLCPICLTYGKDMAFGCGHVTCGECGTKILSCPICRQPIVSRLRIIL